MLVFSQTLKITFILRTTLSNTYFVFKYRGSLHYWVISRWTDEVFWIQKTLMLKYLLLLGVWAMEWVSYLIKPIEMVMFSGSCVLWLPGARGTLWKLLRDGQTYIKVGTRYRCEKNTTPRIHTKETQQAPPTNIYQCLSAWKNEYHACLYGTIRGKEFPEEREQHNCQWS